MTRERPLSLVLITCALSAGVTMIGCTESMIRVDPDAGSTGDSGRPPGDSAVDPDGGTPPVDSGSSDSGTPPGDSGARDSGARDSGAPMGDGGMMPSCNDVTFTLERPGASSVWVSGSWLGWPGSVGAGALELVNDGTGTWSLTTRIEPAGRISYKFIVDGSMWIADPANPRGEPDGFGGTNSVLDVCETPGGMCGDLSAFDWRDAVMYFVMTDRFRNSDSMADRIAGASRSGAASGDYEGGDLDGVTERLPYLAELGVTAIWLSAPYEGRDSLGAAIDPGSDPHLYSAYHGYWPSPGDIRYTASGDLEAGSPEPEVESRIGDSLDLHELVDTAHATTGADGHGMKVLFDYVMKHVDEESGLRAAHPEWFVPLSDGMGSTLCGPRNYWDHPYYGTRCAFTNYLPSFDFYQEAPRQWSVRDAAWWAREYGIDGYRLDAIKHVPLSWLTELRTRIDSEVTAPEGDRFYMVGETFAYDDRELLRRFVDPDTMLDGQFDFPFKARICEALFRPEGRLDGFASWMDGNDGFYGAGAVMSTWIGNHDIPRAIHFASGQITNCREGSNPGNGWNPGAFAQPTDAAPYQRLGLAFVVMMTNPGVPLIYYGDEIGLAGGGDPDNRRMMPWEESSLNEHQRALRDTVRALGRIRGENQVLGRGERTTLSSSQDTWVYRMSGCEAADVIVAINRADGANTVTVPDGAYTDLVTGADATGGSIALSARSFRILRAR